MKTTRITNATVVTPGAISHGATIIIDEDIIRSVLPAGSPLPSADETIDAKGAFAVPGFIDIHSHGAVSYEATDAAVEAIEAIAKAKLEEGVTSYCATTLTLPTADLEHSLAQVAKYREKTPYCKIPGVHLEGPFVNPGALGAQNPAFVRKPDIAEIKHLQTIVPITETTLAVEVEGGINFVRELLENGIIPSCGHSKCSYDTFLDAYKNGLRHLTHFCNQMTALHHRDIGLVGAGLLHGDVNLELICDTIHVSVPMIQLVFSTKPMESIHLITDSMRASHMPDGPSSIGGLDVTVKDGIARITATGALAGSTLRMNHALRNVLEVTGLPIEDVIQTTSFNQAVELGLGDELGRIDPGYTADIVLLDPDNFDVQAVFVDGVKKI